MTPGLRRISLAASAALALAMAGCSVTRYTPSGGYVLISNKVEVDKQAPKRMRLTEEQVGKYIQQLPARRLLGTNIGMSIYNMTAPDNRTKLGRALHGMGSAPVLLDTASTRVSADYIARYVRSRGYFEGSASARVDTARRRARVTYSIKQGEPYLIGRVRYDFKDSALAAHILSDTLSSLLKSGAPFDSGVLDAERTRVKDALRNRGYYNFSVDNVRYVADSTVGGRTVDLTVEVRRYLTDYAEDGSPVMEPHHRYRVAQVNVYPDYDPARAVSDTAYLNNVDTLRYRGLNIVYGHKLRVKREVLRGLIDLWPDTLYSSRDVSRTYSNLMRLGYYRSARIVFSEQPGQGPPVVFAGGDTLSDASPARYMVCNIYCTPSLRQGYNVGLETTFTSDYYGVSATLGYRNRSLLRGVEVFEASLTGSYDFMRVKSKAAAFELGGKASITFPRFVFPFGIQTPRGVIAPRTILEASASAQRRPYYHRVLSTLNWGYSWGGNRFLTFTLRPIDIGVVKVNYLDEDYLESQRNPYLQESYRDQLLAGMSGTWLYNNAAWSRRGNGLTIRLNFETKGNTLQGANAILGRKKEGENFYRILGIRFAQYVRADLSVANSIALSDKVNLVWRLYGGAGLTYGNSHGDPLPFDRLFYAGGSNSMRGWVARTLGPGSYPRPEGDLYPSQLGNMRLEANVEARFPIWSIFRGALFVDAGNVWLVGPGEYPDSSRFAPRSFVGQTALNTGLGIRVDISMAVLRLDWGIRLYDPNAADTQRWRHDLSLRGSALSVGVGYPF